MLPSRVTVQPSPLVDVVPWRGAEGGGGRSQETEGVGEVKMGEGKRVGGGGVGDHDTSWLNGGEMSDLRDEMIGGAEGVIARQIHSGGGIKVRWRNLMVREIG